VTNIRTLTGCEAAFDFVDPPTHLPYLSLLIFHTKKARRRPGKLKWGEEYAQTQPNREHRTVSVWMIYLHVPSVEITGR